MFKVGDKLFLRTVTYHLLGEVETVEGNWLKLKGASWVADSGRFHKAIGNGTLDEVEYVGVAFVNLDTVADAFPWQHDLPTESE
jgi:hypothetical protein